MSSKNVQRLCGVAGIVILLTSVWENLPLSGITGNVVQGGFEIYARSSPAALAMSGAAVAFYVFILILPRTAQGRLREGQRREDLAWLMDYSLVFTSALPVIGLCALLVERLRSGVFRWEFTRSFNSFGVLQIGVEFGFIIGWALLYFLIPKRLHRPTPAVFILRYKFD